ncbi:MAG: 4Fe-4S binding protein [Desulfosalsimonas sp.]
MIIYKKMSIQQKKSFAAVDYETCSPEKCDPENGICAAVAACTHKVIKQMDGAFEQPMIFQHLCMGCWDCIEACPLDAVYVKNVT